MTKAGFTKAITVAVALCCVSLSSAFAESSNYPWPQTDDSSLTVEQRIQPPPNYRRVNAADSSFAEWLRNLPLKPGRPDVLLYNGDRKGNQDAHYAVLDIDIGDRNLQQCADAIIRLRAEYLYARSRYDSIHFNFTSGDQASFREWIDGYRPKIDGNEVTWEQSAPADSAYGSFRKYLTTVFNYAGSYSLAKELTPVIDPDSMQIGDIFIQGGFPGHAVIVIDMAVHDSTGEKIFLLAQSYMPAQDIHILTNNNDNEISPWYIIPESDTLHTPEWIFKKGDLMRFK